MCQHEGSELLLGKSFATSISAWVLPLAALDDAQVPLPQQHLQLLAYLRAESSGYDIDVQVEVNDHLVGICPYAAMYYSPAQMMAHGSGTIWVPEPTSGAV